jgi:cobalt-zinc-cadmium resistance protein CzcA
MLYRFFAKHKFNVVAVFILLFLFGLHLALNIKIDAIPDITNTQVAINTKTGGLDPEQVERSITYQIETAMFGIKGVRDIRSISKYGLSQVIVVFNESTNLYWARAQVSEKLSSIQANLSGYTPQLGAITTGLGEVLLYRVYFEKNDKNKTPNTEHDLIKLRTIQDYTIVPYLKKIQGVADVDSNGGYKKEIHININPNNLTRYGLTIQLLLNKLQTIGQNYGGGYIQTKNMQMIVRTTSNILSIDDLKNVVVKLSATGHRIKLGDIASVKEEFPQRIGSFLFDGEESVMGIVMMQIGANSKDVLESLNEAINSLKLEDGVRIEPIYTRHFLLNSTIKTVLKNVIEGIAFVIIILFLILKNIRASLIAALVIPITAVITAIWMSYLNISANLMSLGAVDFGLLVDASIVIIENSIRKITKGQDFKQRLQIVSQALQDVIKPTCIGIFIIIIVYLPILVFDGAEGKTFKPMALTVIFALASSLLTAVFLVPILTAAFVKQGHSESVKTSDTFVAKYYTILLNKFITRPILIIVPSLVFMVFCFVLFLRLPSEFIPSLNEGDFTITSVKPFDISINKSIEEQKQIEQIAMGFKGVGHVFSRIGSSESGLDPMGVNVGDMYVVTDKTNVKNIKQRNETLASDIVKALQERFIRHQFTISQPVKMKFNEILEGSRGDLNLKIFGSDLDALSALTDKIRDIILQTEGSLSAEASELTALTKNKVLEAEILYDKLSLYDIPISDVNLNLQMAMSGIEIGRFYENQIQFPIIIHMGEDIKNDINYIKQIPVSLELGGSIPISAVANFTQKDKVVTIARNFAVRYSALGIVLKDDVDNEGFVKIVNQKIQEQIDLPQGYNIEWSGRFKNAQHAKQKLQLFIPLLLVVIFFILYKTFNSFTSAFIIYLSIPLALCGGVIGLAVTHTPLSISAMIGFIALFGIAVLNGIVLISYVIHDLSSFSTANNLLLKSLKFETVKHITMTTAKQRLKPILATASVAIFGFVPAVFNNGIGAEVQFPLAVVVIGGIISCTILTLFLLPSLYCLVNNFFCKKNDKR